MINSNPQSANIVMICPFQPATLVPQIWTIAVILRGASHYQGHTMAPHGRAGSLSARSKANVQR